ncbi:DUF791-domain-containing protein [Rhizoclosmatium globosum]|uniref:Molybdate-anion transporter n=1 Tax=Rhizoclosmatium globosum TaxID=329046 RepID=A0A1Y2BSR9_9FUNG|nr:DUF791-domain-containing protein [Rhizoclosmatium globosum]|eukprot:ORY37800.1 DUF791-domain-containing protein [Rhizoclosmatium globosum]
MIVPIFAGLIVLYIALNRAIDYSSKKDSAGKAVTDSSPELTRLTRQYLIIYLAAMFADWIQGPYVYRLYATYGYSVDQIAILFVAGFGSSMLFGTFVGSLADSYGRKNSCLTFCVLYFISCLTKHSPVFEVLMLGRILGGIATSILYAAFEAWLVSESHTRQLHETQLGSIFAAATTGNGIVAIVSGVIASAANDSWGVVAPFDVSVNLVQPLLENFINNRIQAFVLAATGFAILFLWTENYGDRNTGTSIMSQFKFGEAFARIRADNRIYALFVSQSLYESAMYIFVFLWTPTLEKTAGSAGIQHGWIFACFMVCCMIGSEIFSLLVASFKIQVEDFSYKIFAVAGVAFILPVLTNSPLLCLSSFFVFEACCGLYWPVMGTLRGKYIADDVRSTTMTLFRLPLNLIVVVTLMNLKHMDDRVVWVMCATMLLVSAVVQYVTFAGKTTRGYGTIGDRDTDATELESAPKLH